MKVLMLSCGEIGIRVANRLVTLPEISCVDLVQAPLRGPKTANRRAAIARRLRMEGPWATAVSLSAGLLRWLRPDSSPTASPGLIHLDARVGRHYFGDFHSEECLDRVRRLAPDLGVVAGTAALSEVLFAIPRLGSINLHIGKAPEYRSAAPGFWELYNGESEVGITIHRVAKELDAGDIWLQETFPLDPAPAGDPLAYVERYRKEVLQPEGVRMLATAVSGIARAQLTPSIQDPSRAKTYRTPDYQTKRALRRRVALRRRDIS